MRWVLFLGALLGCGGMTSGAAPAIADPPLVMSALTKCRTCHGQAGPGPEINRSAAPALSGLIADRVRSGNMPPWMPGPLSESFAGDYGLTDAERTALLAWSSAGGHLAAEIPDPAKAAYPSGPVVARLMMTAGYVPPPPPVGDEYRCFVLPWTGPSAAMSAYRWALGNPKATHHVTGLVVSAAGAARATTRQGKDGRPGFNCITLPADLDIVADLGASGVGPGGGQVFPEGVGAVIPSGGAIVMQLHYTGPSGAGDVSGIEFWTTQTSAAIKPLRQWALWAPVELPCPTGVSQDPRNRCSREWAIGNGVIQTPSDVRAQADYLLSSCGQTLAGKLAAVEFTKTVPDKWLSPSGCDGVFPENGALRAIHGHMHTQGASIRVEVQESGHWRVLLDIPRWRWWWERAYTFAAPIPIKAGQMVRVSCQHDNGSQVQWSASTHTPGTDSRAELPLEDPAYVVMGFERKNEMCEVFLAYTKDN